MPGWDFVEVGPVIASVFIPAASCGAVQTCSDPYQGFPDDLSKQKTILTVSTRSRSGLLHPFPPKSLTFCPSLGGLQAPSRNILANVANLRAGQVLICNDPRASCPSAFTDISLSKIDVDAAHRPVLTLHLGAFNLCHFQPL